MPDELAERTLDLPDDDVVPARPDFASSASTVGHFRISRELGAGGMGVVFEAYDQDLDRRVAIKVVRDRNAGSAAGQRLIREAQAMARLAHPNVVAVHEVGTVGDQVFVVMELVAGDTLASWLATPHTWRDIVQMFVQAGDGLTAAHDAGLVHGDFKPNNVLLDDTGRIRVADFGLARTDDDERAPTHRRLAVGSRPAGTPGYMAPEQLAGEPYDGRADQYAFAVALRQALQDRGAPRRIRRALDRALSPDPAARFPTMYELLGELRGSLRTRRWVGLAALGVAGASAAITAGIAWSATPERNDCLDGVALVDTVWTPAARTQALAGGNATAGLLEDWVANWQLARRSACSAAPAERPARVACLDGRLADLRAQLAVWSLGDRDVLARALPAAAALPSPETCTAQLPAPTTAPALLVQRIATVNALQRAGRSAQAKPQLATLLPEVEATGDASTLSTALYAAGLVERDLGKHAAAGDLFARSAAAAARAGNDARLVDAMIMQSAIATDRGHPLEAIGVLDAAAAITGRHAVASPALTADLAVARGDALTIAGRLPEALGELRRAVTIHEQLARRDRAGRIRLAAALGALAAAEALSLRHDASRTLLLRVLAIEETEYGPHHPELAKTLHDLANNEGRLLQFAEARTHYDRARAILVTAYGERHHMVALSDYSLGGLELQRERPADARPHFERARAGLLASVGPDHPDLAHVEGALGYLERAADRCREAIPHFERAAAIVQRAGRTGTDLSGHLTNLGACLADLERDAEARPVLERALAISATAAVPMRDRAEMHALLAEIAWRSGNRPQAIALAREVVAVTKDEPEPYATLHEYMKTELAGWLRRHR